MAFEILGVLGDLEVNFKANLQDSKNSKDLEDTLKFPSRLTGYQQNCPVSLAGILYPSPIRFAIFRK